MNHSDAESGDPSTIQKKQNQRCFKNSAPPYFYIEVDKELAGMTHTQMRAVATTERQCGMSLTLTLCSCKV